MDDHRIARNKTAQIFILEVRDLSLATTMSRLLREKRIKHSKSMTFVM